MRSKLIVNPASGPWDTSKQLPAVMAHLQEHGWQTSLHETQRPGEATQLALQAREEGLDAVFVAGGDGTINEVINGLAESDVVLGVLPAGTGNVWAKALGLPRRSPLHWLPLVESIKALVPGSTRRVDLGRVGGHYFLQWIGLGLDAEVTYAMEPRTRTQRRLGAIAYIAAGLSIARTMAGIRSHICIDDRRIDQRCILIVISNSRLYGGVPLSTDARIDDGLLDIDLWTGSGFWSSIRILLTVLTGLHVRDPRHSVFQGRVIQIESDKPMAVHVDGEPFGFTPLRCEVVPRALSVMLPQRIPPRLFSE